MSKRLRGDPSNKLNWTTSMDEKLLDALIYHTKIGNRVGGSFTTYAYDEIVKELVLNFPHMPIDKVKLKNRIKYMKTWFAPVFDVFKNHTSGFAWNSSSGLWDAEDEVWETLIMAHPKMKEWRYKPFFHYDKFFEIWGIDRANGDESETGREIRAKKKKTTSNHNIGNTIDEIDDMLARDEVILEGFEESPIQQQSNVGENLNEDQTISQGEGSSKKRGKLRKEIDTLVVNGLSRIAEAIETSAIQLATTTQRYPIKENEIWETLDKLGFDGNDLTSAYLFLIENPDKLRAVLGAPQHAQKMLLQQMMRNK